MDVVNLLQSKNRCLQRLLECSETFLAAVARGDFSGLEAFQNRRDAVMKALELYDRRISSEASRLTHTERTPEIARAVEIVLARKQEIVRAILVADDRVMAALEREKDRIAGEVSAAGRSHSALGKYKSEWVPVSGEGLDEKL